MALIVACCGCASVASTSTARPDAGAERAFRQDPQWRGGDAALSIALGPNRVLWLFGDSFIAPQANQRRVASTLVRNSIAVQAGTNLSDATMQFVWRRAPDGSFASFFSEPDAHWYWPGHGVRLDRGPLVIFLYEMEATPGAGLGFRTSGYAVALIDNPDSAPEHWVPRIVEGPAMPFDAVPATAVVVERDYVVALAIRQQGTHAGFLVRYPAAALASGDLGSAQWWAGPELGWASSDELGPGGPREVMDDAGPENSMHWDARLGVFVHVASYGFGASVIGVRTATSLTGPWSPPRIVYRPPESDGVRPFVYAAKGHPGLTESRSSELVVTYAVNSFEFEDLLTDRGEASLYWPRVVRVDLAAFTRASLAQAEPGQERQN